MSSEIQPLSEQGWSRYISLYGVISLQWVVWSCSFPVLINPCIAYNGYWHGRVNSLWPSDAIWRLRSGSTSAQAHVTTDCPTAPSHCLNRWWIFISTVRWHSPEGNLAANACVAIRHNAFEYNTSKPLRYLPGANELKINWGNKSLAATQQFQVIAYKEPLGPVIFCLKVGARHHGWKVINLHAYKSL